MSLTVTGKHLIPIHIPFEEVLYEEYVSLGKRKILIDLGSGMILVLNYTGLDGRILKYHYYSGDLALKANNAFLTGLEEIKKSINSDSIYYVYILRDKFYITKEEKHVEKALSYTDEEF